MMKPFPALWPRNAHWLGAQTPRPGANDFRKVLIYRSESHEAEYIEHDKCQSGKHIVSVFL